MIEFSKKYLELVSGEFEGLNLTRITDLKDFHLKQVEDAIRSLDCKLFHVELFKSKTLLDVGFGGGFPILPLAKKLADFKFVGIDARNKKVLAVEKIAEYLGIRNCKFYHYRLEELEIDTEVVITFKAVGKVDELLSKINNSVVTTAFFYKGPDFENEEKNLKLPALWKKISHEEIRIEGLTKRFLIGYKNVPRGTFLKNKPVVKLSSLI